jgi:hypothetical protein
VYLGRRQVYLAKAFLNLADPAKRGFPFLVLGESTSCSSLLVDSPSLITCLATTKGVHVNYFPNLKT